MATYKEVNGTAVQNFAGDYTGAVDGELWYNSTATTFQYKFGATAAAWATGNNLNTARSYISGCGTQTAALAFAGNDGTPPEVSNHTELYNGTAWTEVNNLQTSRQMAGAAGISTAALAFGGNASPARNKTETWNGTNWTEVNDLGTARYL